MQTAGQMRRGKAKCVPCLIFAFQHSNKALDPLLPSHRNSKALVLWRYGEQAICYCAMPKASDLYSEYQDGPTPAHVLVPGFYLVPYHSRHEWKAVLLTSKKPVIESRQCFSIRENGNNIYWS